MEKLRFIGILAYPKTADISESWSLLVRYRRTTLLNKITSLKLYFNQSLWTEINKFRKNASFDRERHSK